MEKCWHEVKETSVSKDDPARAARLSAALRTNLRRRKAQARAVEAAPDEAAGRPPPEPPADDA